MTWGVRLSVYCLFASILTWFWFFFILTCFQSITLSLLRRLFALKYKAETVRAWVWASSGSWWWTRKPGVLQFMGSQRVKHDWETELNWESSGFLLWVPYLEETIVNSAPENKKRKAASRDVVGRECPFNFGLFGIETIRLSKDNWKMIALFKAAICNHRKNSLYL